MAKAVVVLTGACGYVASQLLEAFRDRYELRMIDVQSQDIERADGVPWLVVYGISGNTRAFWSLESARRVLGHEPEDDSEVKYAADIARLLTGPDATIGGGRVGD